jgi:hypothetical protein
MAGPHGTPPDSEAARSALAVPALARVAAVSSAFQAECRGLEPRLASPTALAHTGAVPFRRRRARSATSDCTSTARPPACTTVRCAHARGTASIRCDRSNSRRDSPSRRRRCPRGPAIGMGSMRTRISMLRDLYRPVRGRPSCSGTPCPQSGNCTDDRATPGYAETVYLRSGRNGGSRDGTPLPIRRGCRPARFPGRLGRCRRPDASGHARCAAYSVDRRESVINSASASASLRTTCPAG